MSDRLRRLRALYEAHVDEAWAGARERGLDAEELEDALVEVFVRLHAHLDEAEPAARVRALLKEELAGRAPAADPADAAGAPDAEARRRVFDLVVLQLSGGLSEGELKKPALLIGGGMALSLFLAVAVTVVVAISWDPPPPPPVKLDPVEERNRLELARRALGAGDLNAAEAALADYDIRFPSGELKVEREALEVWRLVVDREPEAARSAAERFRADHPDSPHLELVDRVAPP